MEGDAGDGRGLRVVGQDANVSEVFEPSQRKGVGREAVGPESSHSSADPGKRLDAASEGSEKWPY